MRICLPINSISLLLLVITLLMPRPLICLMPPTSGLSTNDLRCLTVQFIASYHT